MTNAPTITYAEGFRQSMSLNTEVGAMVKYTGKNGYDIEHQNAANRGLFVEQDYEVLAVRVGRSSSEVVTAEGNFNTSIFENTGPVPDEMPDDGRFQYLTTGTLTADDTPSPC
jgi:hypothetical protein